MHNKFLWQLNLEEARCFFLECGQQLLAQNLQQGLYQESNAQIPLTEGSVMTIDEVCTLLKISRPTLNAWMKTKKLSYKRIGRRVYFLRQDVLASLQSFNRRAC